MVLIWITHFLVDVMIGIWPVYKSLAELDLAKAGLIVALGAFIGEGSQLIFGTLSDKGYRRSILNFGLVMSTASVLMSYFSSYWLLFLLYLITCIGSGAFHPSAAGLMNVLDPKRRTLFMSIFSSGGSVGLACSQIIFTYMYLSSPGQTYLLFIPTLVIVLILLIHPFPKTDQALSSSHKICFSDFISFFKRQDLRCLYITLVANQAIFWGVIFILPDTLKILDHNEWICYGGGHLCFILGGALMMIPAGYLADRYSARTVILSAFIIGCVAFYFLLFFGNFSTLLVLINLFLLGSCLAVIQPIGVALGGQLVPTKPGMVSAFLMGLVWCVAETVGPGSVGVLTTLFQDYAPVKALALLGGLFLVGIYASWCLPGQAVDLEEQCPVSDTTV